MRLIDGDALKRQYEVRKRLFCRNRIEFSTLSDKDKARVDELDNCIADILNTPTIESEPKWIPCSERLPESRLYVLVAYKYEYGLIDCGITWYSEYEKKWDTSRKVIAWMPLPTAYQEEGE